MKNSKTIVVTGITSGFGLDFTKKMQIEGYRIIGLVRGGEIRGQRIFNNLENIDFVEVDLKDSTSVDAAIEKVKVLACDGIDILVNNAGYGLLGPIELQTENQIREQFEVNFFAPLKLITLLLPLLRIKRGRIINITSLVGFTTFPFYGSYAATKHALDIITESLYYELRDFGVQVCAIEPGSYKTKFSPNIELGEIDNSAYSFYKNRLDRFKVFLNLVQNKMEKDSSKVVNILSELCIKKTIPTRVQIGSDSKLMWYIKKISPDFLRVKIQHWIYKRMFF